MARLLTVVDAAVVLITDNKGVWNKLRKIKQGHTVTGAHQEEWDQIRHRIHRLQKVLWVKAHLSGPEAAGVAEAKGYPVRWHALNQGADALAARGRATHTPKTQDSSQGRLAVTKGNNTV